MLNLEILLNHPPESEEGKAPYSISNIGNGNPQSLGDFIKAIEANFNKDAKKEFLPIKTTDLKKTHLITSENY